ncbi:Swt1 family HEPN domain-containing protein [Brevundimonas diminuta ATCC 11568]
MNTHDAIKLFGLNNLLIESDIRALENRHRIDLGHRSRIEDRPSERFTAQFTQKLRDEAAEMARHYATFYCLENSIREMISARLSEIHGIDWWEKSVPDLIQQNVAKNYKKELSSGITLRSSEMIDYSNFGELGEIIKANWNVFGDTLNDIGAVQKILASLNTLRAPIAHCKSLAEDEVVRLNLSLADWFRQMA